MTHVNETRRRVELRVILIDYEIAGVVDVKMWIIDEPNVTVLQSVVVYYEVVDVPYAEHVKELFEIYHHRMFFKNANDHLFGRHVFEHEHHAGHFIAAVRSDLVNDKRNAIFQIVEDR